MRAGRSRARTFGILAGACLLLGCVAASVFPKESVPLAMAGIVGYVFTGRSAVRAWNADAIVFDPPAPPPVVAPSAVEKGLLNAAFGSAALQRSPGRLGSRRGLRIADEDERFD